MKNQMTFEQAMELVPQDLRETPYGQWLVRTAVAEGHDADWVRGAVAAWLATED